MSTSLIELQPDVLSKENYTIKAHPAPSMRSEAEEQLSVVQANSSNPRSEAGTSSSDPSRETGDQLPSKRPAKLKTVRAPRQSTSDLLSILDSVPFTPSQGVRTPSPRHAAAQRQRKQPTQRTSFKTSHIMRPLPPQDTDVQQQHTTVYPPHPVMPSAHALPVSPPRSPVAAMAHLQAASPPSSPHPAARPHPAYAMQQYPGPSGLSAAQYAPPVHNNFNPHIMSPHVPALISHIVPVNRIMYSADGVPFVTNDILVKRYHEMHHQAPPMRTSGMHAQAPTITNAHVLGRSQNPDLAPGLRGYIRTPAPPPPRSSHTSPTPRPLQRAVDRRPRMHEEPGKMAPMVLTPERRMATGPPPGGDRSTPRPVSLGQSSRGGDNDDTSSLVSSPGRTEALGAKSKIEARVGPDGQLVFNARQRRTLRRALQRQRKVELDDGGDFDLARPLTDAERNVIVSVVQQHIGREVPEGSDVDRLARVLLSLGIQDGPDGMQDCDAGRGR